MSTTLFSFPLCFLTVKVFKLINFETWYKANTQVKSNRCLFVNLVILVAAGLHNFALQSWPYYLALLALIYPKSKQIVFNVDPLSDVSKL
jgi:hypothetical protein